MKSDSENHFYSELIDNRNTSAFSIQNAWRRYKIGRIIKQERDRIREGIRVFTTSLTYNSKYTSDTERVKHIFDAHDAPFTLIDVVEDKNEWRKLKIEEESFPVIFMFGYFIGTYDYLQELVDLELLDMIIKQEYERRCLQCRMPRKSLENETCSGCWKKYLFFVKDREK